MKNTNYFYHVTSKVNLKSILKNGIKPNSNGQIFLFSELEIWNRFVGKIFVADHIARNQVFLKEYALIEINPDGIINKVTNDDVAEFTSPVQWVLRQIMILPQYLKVIGCRKAMDARDTDYRLIYKWDT